MLLTLCHNASMNEKDTRMSDYVEGIKFRLAELVCAVDANLEVAEQPTMTEFVIALKAHKDYDGILNDAPGLVIYVNGETDELVIQIPERIMH